MLRASLVLQAWRVLAWATAEKFGSIVEVSILFFD